MYGIQDAMIQNLKNAGCNSKTIQGFSEKLKMECYEEGIYLLELHRRTLLETLHSDQRKIDCLDYLVYQLKKNRDAMDAQK